MNPHKRTIARCISLTGMLLVAPICALGARPYAEVSGTAHAKGWVILKASFPNHGTLKGISLSVSENGEVFQPAKVGLPRGRPAFKSVSYGTKETTVVVSVVGRWGMGEEKFLFDQPGEYLVRWGISFEDKNVESLKIHQTVDVGPTTEADLEFLSQMSDPGFLQRFFGRDPFEGSPNDEFRDWVMSPDGADRRALAVIAVLLEATRELRIPDILCITKASDDPDKTESMLLALAKEMPESSYAPYAAYYAGCCCAERCFVQAREAIRARQGEGEIEGNLAEGKYRAALVKQDQDSARADEAFTFAAQRADDYLKPRVLYQHAFVRLMTFDFDEGERLLQEARENAPGEGTVQGWIDKARREAEEGKTKLKNDANEGGD